MKNDDQYEFVNETLVVGRPAISSTNPLDN